MPCRISDRQLREFRLIREAEQQKARQQQTRERVSEGHRLAAIERKWASFKAGVAQAQRQQQREAYFQDLQRTIDGLGRMVNPPPSEPYTPPSEETGTGRLGYSDFDPALMVQPLRWW